MTKTFSRFFSSQILSPKITINNITNTLPVYGNLLNDLKTQGYLSGHYSSIVSYNASMVISPKKILNSSVEDILKHHQPLLLFARDPNLHDSEIQPPQLVNSVSEINSYINIISKKVVAEKTDFGAALLAHRLNLDYNEVLILLLRNLPKQNMRFLWPLGEEHRYFMPLAKFLFTRYVLGNKGQVDRTDLWDGFSSLEKLNSYELANTLYKLIYLGVFVELMKFPIAHQGEVYFTEDRVKKLLAFQILRRINRFENDDEVEGFKYRLKEAMYWLSKENCKDVALRA